MQNVPKIVSERLRAMAPVVDHPDADMLTAFTEHSLPDRERGAVMEHLARCHDCRDIVALALPASETIQPVIISTRTGWLTWPVLRWGLVTAGIVAVASFGIIQYQHQSRQSMVAKDFAPETATNYSQTQPSNATTAESSSSAERTADDKALGDKTRETVNPSATVLPATPAANAPSGLPKPELTARNSSPSTTHLPQRGQTGGPFSGASVNKYQMQSQWQQKQQQVPAGNRQNADMAARLKAPSTSQTVEVSGASSPAATPQSSQIDMEASNRSTQPPDQFSESQPESMFDNTQQGLVRAKPAVNAVSGAAIAIPRWAINAAGRLQRSFDQGTTWQDVNVTANLAPYGTSFAQGALAVSVEEKKETPKVRKDISALPASIPVFRAVAATEADVWAGGSSGTLYHSLDAGNHWTQILPSAAGATLTGDVVRIEFSDAQHGKITTSTAEIWNTSDDGLTWQKQ